MKQQTERRTDMSKYAELQNRLTVATERNRTNIERRDELLETMQRGFRLRFTGRTSVPLAQKTKDMLGRNNTSVIKGRS